jgi:hypothetical protein
MIVINTFYQQMSELMRSSFGGDDGGQIGMDPMGFMMDMPLPGLLHFMGGGMPVSPEDIVDDMLEKVYGTP